MYRTVRRREWISRGSEYLYTTAMSFTDVFYLDLSPPYTAPNEDMMLSVLDKLELERYQRYKSRKAQILFLITRWLIKHLLSDHTQKKPESHVFQYSKNGKPSLIMPENHHFSLAHSDTMIAIAISSHPVGIDVEHYTHRGNPWENLEAYLNADIASRLAPASRPQEQQLFFARYWTALEAFVKLKGSSLFLEKDSFAKDFEIHADDQCTVAPCAYFYQKPIHYCAHLCFSQHKPPKRIGLYRIDLQEQGFKQKKQANEKKWLLSD